MADAVAGCEAGVACFSGKLMGGSFGGTGMGAAVVAESTGGGSGFRRNTPMSGAEAAGAGP